MREPARQFVLDLPVDAGMDREDFLVSRSNAEAWRALESWRPGAAWPAWPDRLLHLHGPRGSGKSHLAAIWAARATGIVVPACAISEAAVPDLATSPALVVEDVDQGPLDEPSLFHLVNLARESRVSVVFTSAMPLDAEAVRTPDLLSRLRSAPRLEIGAPEDALLRAVFVKLFADRQLAVEANVVDYLVVRIERSLACVAETVLALDRVALSRSRPVTRAIAAEVLGAAPEGAECGD